uniref:phosphatidylinositol-3,4,5-trisphosphate 5-phosphatase n=1 Tax=Mastacembelus armatus TaxID=205130 RepID=A0A7N8YCI9_9TELE
MPSYQPWYHGNITRSKAEDLLSKAARDGSFLIRDSESIQGAYALCVLYQNCVYTYRILPNEDKKLSVQASEGVPIRFFDLLPELVDAYYSPNMGLVTHLQYSVQREEEVDEDPGQNLHSICNNIKQNECLSYKMYCGCFSVLQLVKSQKMHTKLVIVVETEKEKVLRKEFVFDDTKKREGFCQLLQQMKNKHSEKPEPDMITVFVGTWNMGNAGPPHNISSWFQCKGQGKTQDDTTDHIPHDFYVIGTQEDPLGEREWADTVKNYTFPNMQVAMHTLWNIRIVVLAKPEHENRISHIFSDSVKTGIANTLGNKGAVGVSFMFNGTSFGFVNSHLTSGSEKKLRRNQNYTTILRFLNLGDKKLNPFDITHRFTHLFWLGDLNYRVEFPSTQYQELLSKDQLNMERNDGKVFLHFDEEEITFAPTYRFERYTRDKYAYTKAKATGTKYNLPSWCDRVLRKSYPLVHVVCQAYGCTNDIMTSDHSPVFASFEIGVASQFVSKQDPNSAPQGGIQIMNCKATLLTKSKTKFFIEYHSSFLESICILLVFKVELLWRQVIIHSLFCLFFKLTPIISDPEYLLDQHIVICVKSTDCDESYGEGCIALRAAQFCYTEFQVTLTHHGEKTGTLTGGIQLHTSEGKPTEKLYGEFGNQLRTYFTNCFLPQPRPPPQGPPLSPRIHVCNLQTSR